MILKSDLIARELEKPTNKEDPLIITPRPNIADLQKSGAASIDIRLGCWFLACRQSRAGLFDVYEKKSDAPDEAKLTKSYYVPFGDGFILHPSLLFLRLLWSGLDYPLICPLTLLAVPPGDVMV